MMTRLIWKQNLEEIGERLGEYKGSRTVVLEPLSVIQAWYCLDQSGIRMGQWAAGWGDVEPCEVSTANGIWGDEEMGEIIGK